MRHRWPALLRVLVGLGLLAYLVGSVDRRALAQAMRTALEHPAGLGSGVALTLAALAVGALRWGVILRALGFPLPYRRVGELFFIGQFFNAFMLGSCGGDLARAVLVTREWQERKTEAAATIFIDRLAGLFVVVLFGCAMIVARRRLFFDSHAARMPGLVMLAFLAFSAALLVVLFRRHLFGRAAWLQRWADRTRVGSYLRRAYDTFFLFRQRRAVLGAAVALSLLNLALLALACACFGFSLRLPAGVADYFTFFPVITVLSALPLTPAGFGVREALFVTLFGAVGTPSSGALWLSFLTYGGGLAWSLAGGLLFLVHGRAAGLTPSGPPRPASPSA